MAQKPPKSFSQSAETEKNKILNKILDLKDYEQVEKNIKTPKPPTPTHNRLDRKGIVPFQDVISFIKSGKKVVLLGESVKTGSVRLQLFAKGHICVICGAEGSYFAVERSPNQNSYHLNLYGINSQGQEVLFTKDHIHPKSLGGADTIDNMQCMCKICNETKGNTV